MIRLILWLLLAFTVAVLSDASAQIIHGSGGGGGGVTGWPTVSTTKDVTWANALANAIRFGDGTDFWALYRDPTDGLQFVCVVAGVANDCNYIRKLDSGKYWGIADSSGNPVFQILPSAATPKAKYPFSTGYYPLKSFSLDARAWEGDGTNCPARPTVATVGNMPMPTYICTENNSSRLRTKVKMRNDWDGGVIYVELHYAQTAADTGSVAYEVAAACRASGTAFNGTYGTEVEVDDAAVTGSGAIDSTLSAAITPNGTCAAKDWLFLYVDVDATDNPTTAAATLHFVSADVFYSSTSLSH